MEKIDYILIERLVELYSPWERLGTSPRVNYDRFKPRKEYRDGYDQRTIGYHYGRIRYFRDLLRAGEKIDPIVLDNECWNGRVLPEPVVIDGHHRFCGAVLAKVEKIPASYSGRVDLLRYLKGLRKTVPT